MPTLFIIVLLGLVIASGFFAKDIAGWLNSEEELSLSQYCPLSTQGCQQDNIRVTLNRDTVQPLIAVKISANWPKSDAAPLRLTLHGYEMDMGTALFELKAHQNGFYQAEVLLPACTVESMTWIGQLSDGHQSMNVSIRMAR